MPSIVPYLQLAGTARDALSFYAEVFGGEVEVHSFGEFGRADGPVEAVAHGILRGPVELFAADAGEGEATLQITGVQFSLLGAAAPEELTAWFGAFSVGGTVLDPLQLRPWGDWDGQVIDRFGVAWLIGFDGGVAA